jgi:hypothetical protein
VRVTVWVRGAEIELREMREGELSRLELRVWLDLWPDIVRNIDALRSEPEPEGEARWPEPPRPVEGSCPCDMLDDIADWLDSVRLCLVA